MFKNNEHTEKQRFSIKKYSFGVTSALVGVFLAAGANSAQASEVSPAPTATPTPTATTQATPTPAPVATTQAAPKPAVTPTPVATTSAPATSAAQPAKATPEAVKSASVAPTATTQVTNPVQEKEKIQAKSVEFKPFEETFTENRQDVYVHVGSKTPRPDYSSVIYDKNDRPFAFKGGQLNGELDSQGRVRTHHGLGSNFPDGNYTHVFKTSYGNFEDLTLKNGEFSYGAYGFNVKDGKVTEVPVTNRFKDVNTYNIGKLNLNVVRDPSGQYVGISSYDAIIPSNLDTYKFTSVIKDSKGNQVVRPYEYAGSIGNGDFYNTTYGVSQLVEGEYTLESELLSEKTKQLLSKEQLKFRITATGEVEIGNPKIPEVGVTPTQVTPVSTTQSAPAPAVTNEINNVTPNTSTEAQTKNNEVVTHWVDENWVDLKEKQTGLYEAGTIEGYEFKITLPGGESGIVYHVFTKNSSEAPGVQDLRPFIKEDLAALAKIKAAQAGKTTAKVSNKATQSKNVVKTVTKSTRKAGANVLPKTSATETNSALPAGLAAALVATGLITARKRKVK